MITLIFHGLFGRVSIGEGLYSGRASIPGGSFLRERLYWRGSLFSEDPRLGESYSGRVFPQGGSLFGRISTVWRGSSIRGELLFKKGLYWRGSLFREDP